MKPSTKAALAVNGLIELAKMQPAKPLALSTLAEKQSISLSYLEQVFAALRRAGLVLSVRGPGGGYLLARPAHAITTGEIVGAVDQDIVDERNSELTTESDTSHEEPVDVVMHTFWGYITQRVSGVYHEVSLQDVLDGTYARANEHKDLGTQAAE